MGFGDRQGSIGKVKNDYVEAGKQPELENFARRLSVQRRKKDPDSSTLG